MKDQIILTQKQEEIVNATTNELLIRGIAGSGKTLVILRKAKKMAEENPNKKVAIFTFNKTLKASAEYQIAKFNLKNLTVTTFHSWAYNELNKLNEILNDSKYRKSLVILNDSKISEYIKEVSKTIPSGNRFTDEKYIDFIKEEIKWIKGMGIKQREEYLNILRTGRGSEIRVSKDDREVIYSIYEKYEKKKKDKLDYSDFAIKLYENKQFLSTKDKYDIVFIDEAQDLELIQLKLLRDLTHETFIVAADKGQKIYTSSFTWKDIGLNIIGGRTKILNETFRSTKQIVELARSMQMNDIIKKDDEFIESIIPTVEGVKPTWYKAKDFNTMLASIFTLSDELLLDRNVSIGILGRTWSVLKNLEKKLQNNGYDTEQIKDNDGNTHSPGIKLTTYHSAKGLEFDYVFMIVNKSNTSIDLDLNVERRLYYVSMTRAKGGLYIFSEQNYLEILDELDENLYTLKNL